jgi:hypothetical protein
VSSCRVGIYCGPGDWGWPIVRGGPILLPSRPDDPQRPVDPSTLELTVEVRSPKGVKDEVLPAKPNLPPMPHSAPRHCFMVCFRRGKSEHLLLPKSPLPMGSIHHLVTQSLNEYLPRSFVMRSRFSAMGRSVRRSI